MAQIIGRQRESRLLQSIYDSGKSEFVVVYGRRRVGKTFLLREFFKDRFTFYHTGLSPKDLPIAGRLQAQLDNFAASLSRYGADITGPPKSWTEAFEMLTDLLEKAPQKRRQVVFIDEMPWMDTAKSMFLSAFEHFWNGWGAGRDNLVLIACGSATSWMSEELLENSGGLYNRVTRSIALSPFSLHECREYFDSAGIKMDDYDLAQAYMVTGGIPYYMSCFEKGRSLAQNIDKAFFEKNAPLENEFSRLFTSIFINAGQYEKAVRFIATRRYGYTRKEISEGTGIATGAGLTKILKGLEDCDLVVRYRDFMSGAKEYYKLTDAFCLFYLHFVDGDKTNNPTFWQDNQFSPAVNAWRGLAFEDLCFNHLPQIRRAIGIAGVSAEVATWICRGSSGSTGSQIDMVIKRADRVVSLCEMKFCVGDFEIDKDYDAKLRERLSAFQSLIGNRLTPQLTLVTSYGLKNNMYSGRIQSVITMEDLAAAN